MPKTKSAKRALRKSKKRRLRNLERKKKMKETIKKFKNLILEKKKEEAEKTLPEVYQVLDKMAKVGLIKRGKAARMKSKMAKLLVSSFSQK